MNMKYASLITLAAVGCGVSGKTQAPIARQAKPHVAASWQPQPTNPPPLYDFGGPVPARGPQRDMAKTATVVFIGDQLTYSALQQITDQPGWINAATNAWETSASMLARFQSDVLDLHPDTVVIWAGEGDLVTYPNWSGENECGEYTDPSTGENGSTCQNWAQMAEMAQAAGVKCIIADLSEYAYQPDADSDEEIFGYNEEVFKDYSDYGGEYGSYLAQFDTDLSGDQYFVNGGMQVSAAGALEIESVISQMLAGMNVGGQR